jgi:hypothetical protein
VLQAPLPARCACCGWSRRTSPAARLSARGRAPVSPGSLVPVSNGDWRRRLSVSVARPSGREAHVWCGLEVAPVLQLVRCVLRPGFPLTPPPWQVRHGQEQYSWVLRLGKQTERSVRTHAPETAGSLTSGRPFGRFAANGSTEQVENVLVARVCGNSLSLSSLAHPRSSHAHHSPDRRRRRSRDPVHRFPRRHE